MRSGADRHQEAIISAPRWFEDEPQRWTSSGPWEARKGLPLQRGGLWSQDRGSKSGRAGTGVVAAGVPVSLRCESLLAWQCLTLSGQGWDAGLRWPDWPWRKKAWICSPRLSSEGQFRPSWTTGRV